jgi:hypothetical protein
MASIGPRHSADHGALATTGSGRLMFLEQVATWNELSQSVNEESHFVINVTKSEKLRI